MGQVEFDFFNGTHVEWLKSFCSYFELSEEDVDGYLDEVDCDQLDVGKVTQDLNINLTNYNSNSISIVCRHMTTATSISIEAFKTHGILDLKRMLQEKTSLSNFLKKHGVVVDVEKRIIYINEQAFPIISYGEPCEFCFEGRKILCDRHYRCESRGNMEELGRKLYKYGGTLEFFMNATIEQMERYSCIHHCPEIIQTLDKILSNDYLFATPARQMSGHWIDTNPECYIVEFVVQLSNMETYEPMSYDAAWYEISDCLKQSGYNQDDYYKRNIPQNVLNNMVFIRWFISIYYYDSEELGSLISNMSIEPEKIRKILKR